MRVDLAAMAARTTSGADDGEVFSVMLANAEEVESDLIGERALVDDLTERCGLRQLLPMVIDRDISKRVETQFNRACVISVRLSLGVEFKCLRHLGVLSWEVRAVSNLLADRKVWGNKLYTLSLCTPR